MLYPAPKRATARPLAACLATAWALIGCGETVNPAYQINIQTPPDQDPLATAVRVELQLGGEKVTTTAITPGQTFELSLKGLRPRQDQVAVISVTAFDAQGAKVALGATPPLEIGLYNVPLQIRLQAPGTLAQGPGRLQVALEKHVMLAAPALGPVNVFAVPILLGGQTAAIDAAMNITRPPNPYGWAWNPAVHSLDEFSTLTISSARFDARGLITDARRVIVFGGQTGDASAPLSGIAEVFELVRFDLISFDLGPLPQLGTQDPAVARHGAPLVELGRVFAIGGIGAAGALDSVAVMDLASATPATAITLLPQRSGAPRAGHTVTRVLGPGAQAEALIFGGAPAGSSDAVAEIFNPNAPAPAAPFSPPATPTVLGDNRTGHNAVLLPATDARPQSVFIIGGRGDDGLPRADAVLYHPITRTFTPSVARLQTARTDATAFLVGNDVVMFGGLDAAGAPIGNAEVFDARTLLPVLTLAGEARMAAGAAPLPDGTMLLIGGTKLEIPDNPATPGNSYPSSAVEIYRPRL